VLKKRSVSEHDRTLVETFISKDADHAGRCNADFWLPAKEKDSTARFVMEDALGPCLFVRGENVLRLHIQFSDSKMRNGRALIDFIPMIEEDARKHGFKQIIWDSVSPDLIKFTERFGYRTSPNEVVKDL
jgi:hypothetical protein